ncbi:MAG TPA: BTAD domain-containing putative transcriptional regulator, partial [Actinomycetes bacterium]|nr:BTAD domain-containing putative transcriptional regulator [Actinomycetes bacterium]
MRFGIPGPLEASDGGRLLDLGRPKQRALLAILLIHANTVVSADKLVDDLWAGEPPDDGFGALQVQVSRLRKALDGKITVESRKPGYVLHVNPDALDARRFKALVDAARSAEPGSALRLLDDALALWRGPALAEFADQPFAMAEAARLEELRIVAVEERVEAELALGRHATVVGLLRQLVGRHQLRERLWGQLMVALYRCGRQAEALRAYAELRHHLGEELGIDPSPALRRLEEAVLLQSPELDWTAPSATSRRPGAALPFPLAGAETPFVGRRAEVGALRARWRAAMGDGPRLVLLAGEPGVGKTRLALELARSAHAEGARVLVGHCDEQLAVPYQPFAEALARAFPTLSPEERDACVAGRGGELVRLVPELADLVDDLPPPVSSDPETERYRLFQAVSRTLAALSRLAPVVLVLDDLHWAATPTILLLRHVVLRADTMPLLVVGTYRDTERAGPLDLLGTAERITRLPLTGLDEDAVGELVGAAAGERLAGLTRSIHAGTAGNPFFIGEVMRNLTDEGGAPGEWSIEATGVPEGVRSVVRRRLGRLSETTSRLLVVASVIGAHYHLNVLQAAVDLDEDRVLAGLDEAMAAGLVAEAGD